MSTLVKGESTGQKHSVSLHVEDPKCKMLLSEKQIFCSCCCFFCYGCCCYIIILRLFSCGVREYFLKHKQKEGSNMRPGNANLSCKVGNLENCFGLSIITTRLRLLLAGEHTADPPT